MARYSGILLAYLSTSGTIRSCNSHSLDEFWLSRFVYTTNQRFICIVLSDYARASFFNYARAICRSEYILLRELSPQSISLRSVYSQACPSSKIRPGDGGHNSHAVLRDGIHPPLSVCVCRVYIGAGTK